MKTSFKTTSIVVGLIMSLLAIALFAKGLMSVMSEYGVPAEVLNSPHYVDAVTWVYLHMIVIGLFIITFGYTVTEPNKQKWVSLVVTMVLSIYTYLDFVHSDSSLGNALYKGNQSLAPAIISLLLTIAFFRLTIKLFRS